MSLRDGLLVASLTFPLGLGIHLVTNPFYVQVNRPRIWRVAGAALMAVWLVSFVVTVRAAIIETCAAPLAGYSIPLACPGGMGNLIRGIANLFG